MFKNYLKIAWRNLIKNRAFSVINITGLAIGLSCFLLIALYVLDELSYDRFYPNANDIYRINSDVRFGGSNLHIPQTSDMIGATMKKDYPQVLEYTRIWTNSGNKLIKKVIAISMKNMWRMQTQLFFLCSGYLPLQGIYAQH